MTKSRDTKRAKVCEHCGISHRRWNVKIADKVLLRTVTKEKQRIGLYGGAWGFAAQFWDVHSGEFHRVQVLEKYSGIVWHVDIDTFIRYSFRRTLDRSGRAGEQIILPLRYWKQLDTRTGPHDGGALADVTPQMETAQALTMTPAARPVFGDREWLRKAHAKAARR